MGPLKERMRTQKRRAPLVITLLLLAALTAAAVYAGWHFSPSQKLLRALEAEELEQVQQLSAEMDTLPEGFAEKICEKLEALGNRYTDGSCDYAAADAALRSYEAMAIPGTADAAGACRTRLEQIRISREAYVRGQQLEAAKDYPAAMECYTQVSEEDRWGWENAQQKIQQCRDAYRNLILQEAGAFAQAGAYSDAIARLQNGLSILENDPTLTSQMEAYILAQADKERQELISQAQALADGGDYPAALALLAGQEEAELQQAYLSLREAYAEWSMMQAQAVLLEIDYQASLAVIEEALLLLPDHEALLAAKALYESYAPVYLAECALLVSEGSKLCVDEHTADQEGNTYTHSLALNKGSLTIPLQGEYVSFSGTIACPAGFAEDSYRTGAGIEISADGVVIYSSGILSVHSQPKRFQLDISGVQELTITWQCEGPNIWKNWGDRATLWDAALYRWAESD